MINREAEYRKNKIKGIVVSVAVHSLLLLLFFFMIAWRMPDPPPPGLPGMEINLGFVDAGSGDEQTNIEEVSEEQPAEEVVPEEVTEESIVTEEKLVTTDLESDHKVKEVVEKKEVKKNNPESVKEKKEVVEAKNVYNSNTTSDGNKDVKGDQGKEEGNPDSRNLYDGNGNKKGAGTSDGGLLNLPGWKFDYVPQDADLSAESGYVVFQFRIDENGKVESVKKIEVGNLSPTAIDFYKKKLLSSTFKPKDPNYEPDKGETGTMRFNVKAK